MTPSTYKNPINSTKCGLIFCPIKTFNLYFTFLQFYNESITVIFIKNAGSKVLKIKILITVQSYILKNIKSIL